MLTTKNLFRILSLIFILTSSVLAGESNNGKISGYMFGDYYYEFSNPDDSLNALNQNGFQFRRIYFTYDRDMSENFSIRFRLELKSAAGETITPFVKNAYVAWKNLIPNATIYFGAQGTPTWSTSEREWGYRSVEKTIMDLYKVASSSDFGLGVKGNFDKTGTVGYQVLFANGEGTKGEGNPYKKIYISVPIKLGETFQFAPYADFEGGPEKMTKQTIALFAGIKLEPFKVGVEVFQKTHAKKAENGDDIVENGVSVFGSLRLWENINGFARYDIYDPNTDVNKDGKNFIATGLDFKLAEGVNIMPHAKIETYEASGKDATASGVITFYYKF